MDRPEDRFMPRAAVDRNLLFGILALQLDFVTKDQLVAAMHAWVLEKHRPLGDLLVRGGALEPAQCAALDAMMACHLAKHGGDAAASLASLSSAGALASSLRKSIADPEILQSLRSVPPTWSGGSSAPGTPGDPGSRPGGPGPGADRDSYATRDDAPPPGSRYRKVREHARGGLGVVFLARDAELNREVALKEIQDGHADHKHHRAKFLFEAEVTGGLEHPGIVPVYGLGHHDDGRPFYAMRFIKGDSLRHAIAAFHGDESLRADPGRRTLALQKLLRRFLDVCDAIGYAHSRGVLHRDLKPDNVMVGRYGETLVVDWGLAKSVGRSGDGPGPLPEATISPSSASGSEETLPGSVLGTPAYMSPEQAEGRLDLLGPASDIYSLGATLYCLLTGRPPVSGPTLVDVLRSVMAGEIARPRVHSPWLDPALEAVCLKAMALRPGDRYPTPRALGDDLDRWIADEPVTAWKEPATRIARRWLGRNRTLVAAAVSLLATATITLGVASVLINEQSKNRGIAVKEKTEALDKAQKSAAAAELARRNEAAAAGEARESAAAAELARANEAAAASRARDEAAKVVGVIGVLVNTFRTSDPYGMEGLGLRRGTESAAALPAREILDRSSHAVDRELADQPLVRATLLDSIGDVYRSLTEFEKADRMLREALAIRVRLLGRDDPEIATTLIHLGWLHQDRGQFDEAERAYTDALARRSARFGPDSAEAIEVKGRLGFLWAFEQDSGRAEAAFREVIEKLGRLRGEDDRVVALARLGLAATLFEVERTADALLESGKALSILIKGQESEQLTLAMAKYQGGYLMQKAGRFGPAERLFREGLELFRGLFGPDHPYLAFFLHEIGRLDEEQGRLAEAEASYRSGIDLIRRSVGLRHPKARIAVGSLAALLARSGRVDEARGLGRELVEVRRAAFGPDHAWVADALVLSAAVADLSNDAEAQREMLREALAIYRKPRSQFPVGLAECLNSLGLRRLTDGANGEAVALFREAVPLVQKQYGASSRIAGIVKKNLARALTLQGKVEDVEETDRLFGEALGVLRPWFGPAAPEASIALSERADFERRRGRFDRAEAMAQEAYESTRGSHPGAAGFARDLAGVIADRGDARRAVPLLEEAIERDRTMRPADANGLAFDRTLLALAYATAGDREGHRRVVAGLLEGWDRRTMDDGLWWITWAASRFPDAVDDPDRLAKLSARVVAAAPGDLANRLAGAAALIRAGRCEEAAERLEQIRHDRRSEYGYDSLFLAIAQAKRGQAVAARAALARAAAWIDGPDSGKRDWNDRLELSILRREAEALVAAPVLELPADVFAPDRG